jgi:cytosine/adenosine deaminase-related metal-dependent hydrolase
LTCFYIPNAVAIRDDQIVAVGTAEELASRFEANEVVDCTNKAIMPGLVNAHTHVPMTLLRGLNDDLRLDVWLGYLMPVEREFVTPDFVRLGTQVACAEMIRSGVTTFADMYYYEETIAETTADIGMRALLGQTVLVFPAPDAETYEDALVLCRRFIEKWKGHPLIHRPFHLTPGTPQPPNCSGPVPTWPGLSMYLSIPTLPKQPWKSKTAAGITTCPSSPGTPNKVFWRQSSWPLTVSI